MKRIVIKIGSSSIVNEDLSINKKIMLSLMRSIALLKEKGIEVALVSSGAIALGRHALALTKKPSIISLKQACAAIGQAKLMEEYNKAADYYDLITGQILVSHDDFQIRKRMLYLSNTLDAMFQHGVVPIINENDALAVEEIKVGDNDTLAALIAPMIHADLVILFSDVDGLYNKNPKTNQDAELIKDVFEINSEISSFVGALTSNVGTGGMETKLTAAAKATVAGTDLIICNSNRIDDLLEIVLEEKIGTLFHKSQKAISSREHWIIYKTNSVGKVVIDDGCKKALFNKKVSILAKGVIKIVGNFLEDSVIDIVDNNDNRIAKGISKLSSNDIERIKGLSNQEIKALGIKHPEIVHANDLVILHETL